jgi:hypothetical protein
VNTAPGVVTTGLCFKIIYVNITFSPWFAISKLMGIFFVLILFGFLPWVDNFAHVFGFISGGLISLVIIPYITFNRAGFFYTRKGRIVVIVACLLVLALHIFSPSVA